MQNIELTILGSYYDSQLYAGLLYLWTINGDVITVNWDELMDDYIKNNVHARLKMAVYCAFQRSNALYEKSCSLIFNDDEVRSLLSKRFQTLSSHTLIIDSSTLNKFTIKRQRSPFPFPHSDALVYMSKFYLSSPDGLFCSQRGGDRNPIMPGATKLTDCPVLGLSASVSTLALSAGSDGLYEYYLDEVFAGTTKGLSKRPLIQAHSSSSGWMYYNIFSSSIDGGGHFAHFSYNEDRSVGVRNRTFHDVVVAEKLTAGYVGSPIFSWGLGDKICMLKDDGELDVVKYSRNADRAKPTKRAQVPVSPFSMIGSTAISQNLHSLSGQFIKARSAVFGYLVETDSGLFLKNSSGDMDFFPGEPINWRIFPDSDYYTNQLHIVYDNHIVIKSFNEDYFIDQETKLIGISSYAH